MMDRALFHEREERYRRELLEQAERHHREQLIVLGLGIAIASIVAAVIGALVGGIVGG